MDSLHGLRRAGLSKEKPCVEELHVEDAEEPDIQYDMLMAATLRDTEDTEESLTKLESELADAQEPVPGLGGSRHATTLISGRTLTVVRRKRQLLQLLEERIAAFDEAQAQCKEILEGMKQEPNYAVPMDLLGMDKVANEHVHKRGNPADTIKADFQIFASSFGLPQGHQVFRRMEAKATQATYWWAEAALREAQAGTETTTIRQILNLAVSILGSPNHEAIVCCKEFLAETIAENTLRNAQVLRDKDRELVTASNKAQPESARICSDWINEEIRTAVATGAQPGHHCLNEAKRIAEELLEEEKVRLARKVLEYALAQKQKDQATVQRAGGKPMVGPASWAADAIEREIREAVDKGAFAFHPSIKDAKNLAKMLRDEDAMRKRLAARDAREFRDS